MDWSSVGSGAANPNGGKFQFTLNHYSNSRTHFRVNGPTARSDRRDRIQSLKAILSAEQLMLLANSKDFQRLSVIELSAHGRWQILAGCSWMRVPRVLHLLGRLVGDLS